MGGSIYGLYLPKRPESGATTHSTEGSHTTSNHATTAPTKGKPATDLSREIMIDNFISELVDLLVLVILQMLDLVETCKTRE
jgi:hypothetical protein